MRAPAHWPLEVMSLLLKAERRGRLSADGRAAARSSALLLFEGVRVEATTPAAGAFDLAIQHNISVYDAAYLDLAIKTASPLLTDDKALRRAAAAMSVSLLP